MRELGKRSKGWEWGGGGGGGGGEKKEKKRLKGREFMSFLVMRI